MAISNQVQSCNALKWKTGNTIRKIRDSAGYGKRGGQAYPAGEKTNYTGVERHFYRDFTFHRVQHLLMHG
jgi:hypothetical protein